MPLNFGNSLITNPGLFDDIGSIRGRWNQDGSTLINIAETMGASDGTARTIYTVTAGKTLYVGQITVLQGNAWNGNYNYLDGAGGTSKMFFGTMGANQTVAIPFDPPLSLTDSIVASESVTQGDALVTITGWEE